MSEENILLIVEELTLLELDLAVPKNVRNHIRNAIYALQDNNGDTELKVDKALQELSDADEDPNIPQYTRTRIWEVVSALESKA